MDEIRNPLAGHNSKRRRSVYAITFDLDTEELKRNYPVESYNNAYYDISRFLRDRGFERVQGSVHFGDESVNAVTCQTVVGRLTLEYEWFARSVRDIRMLRIEDDNDLSPMIELALEVQAKKA
ncbi:MAG: virulence factor [Hyphomicrobiales bacterium]|nr:virulence factor [Hyphomicrobiales bacterium]